MRLFKALLIWVAVVFSIIITYTYITQALFGGLPAIANVLVGFVIGMIGNWVAMNYYFEED